MKQLIKTIEQTNPKLLFWLIVGTSIVLAAWMQHIQHGWINPDSVLYLEAAKRIVINDFKGAYQIFNWPFYAFCIGTVSKITHLNVHVSAQFLNMIFFAITTASFLNIIRLAGGKNLALFAGALLLFSNTYIVGDVLEMLMRDEGFWAFYLTSILYFIKHHENGQTRHAILWQASAILALLFRIEGLVYLLVLPLIHLFNHQISHKRRLENILNTYSISLIALLIILISVNTIDSLSMSNFGRLKEVFNTDLWLSFSRNFREKTLLMDKTVLFNDLEGYSEFGLMIIFSVVIIVKNLKTLGLVGSVAVLLVFKQKFNHINNNVKNIIYFVVTVSFIIEGLIITEVFVLSSRYIVPLTFMLLIISAVYLEQLLKKVSSEDRRGNQLLALIAILFMCLSLIKNIMPKGVGYNYTQYAITWINNHDPNANIFYEDSRLRYYANAPYIGATEFSLDEIIVARNIPNSYDYLLIKFGKNDQHKLNEITKKLAEYKEIKRFYARKNKKYCVIYQNINTKGRN